MGRGGGGGGRGGRGKAGGRPKGGGGGGETAPEQQSLNAESAMSPEDAAILKAFYEKLEAEFAPGHYGMTIAEWSAMERYTGWEAYQINEALYKGAKLEGEVAEWVAGIDSAMKKLPTYEGTVYRGLGFGSPAEAAAFADDFVTGQGVTMKAYTSAAKDVKAYQYETYTNPHQVQIEFRNARRARDMTGEGGVGRALNAAEREVVFERNTQFKVISKRYGSGGQIQIVVEEL